MGALQSAAILQRREVPRSSLGEALAADGTTVTSPGDCAKPVETRGGLRTAVRNEERYRKSGATANRRCGAGNERRTSGDCDDISRVRGPRLRARNGVPQDEMRLRRDMNETLGSTIPTHGNERAPIEFGGSSSRNAA